jgi:hypothetical protein
LDRFNEDVESLERKPGGFRLKKYTSRLELGGRNYIDGNAKWCQRSFANGRGTFRKSSRSRSLPPVRMGMS